MITLTPADLPDALALGATPTNIETVREFRVEAEGIEAIYGSNPYSAYLRTHGRRPSRAEAAYIGRSMGGRVRADDGTMQPPRARGGL